MEEIGFVEPGEEEARMGVHYSLQRPTRRLPHGDMGLFSQVTSDRNKEPASNFACEVKIGL